MTILIACNICHEPMALDVSGGLRFHPECAERYDRQVRGHVIGIMVTMGVVALILFGILGLLAL